MIWFLLGTNWNCLILVCPRGHSQTTLTRGGRQVGGTVNFKTMQFFPLRNPFTNVNELGRWSIMGTIWST